MANEKKPNQPAVGDPANPEQPTLADVMQAIQQMGTRLDQHEEFLGQVHATLTGEQEPEQPTLEQLTQASDEELAQLGLTRAEVNAAVQEVLAGMEAEGRQPGEQQPGQGERELVGAAASAPGGGEAPGGFSGGEAPATFNAMNRRLIQLESNQKLIELRKKQEAEEVELKSIEQKVLVLAAQRDEAIQLAETQASEIAALRMAVRTGTRPVVAGVGEDGVRLFGANDNGQLHEFQVRVKQLVDGGKSEGQAIQLAVKENPARHADYVASLANKKVA